MGIPQIPSSPHPYPQEIQLKLYQAFIFSIPILFSIILFLLFYLFFLKRRASNFSILPRTSNQPTTSFVTSSCAVEHEDELPVVLFDENLMASDSQCCVCLGEFEMKEELHQLPSCKHVFHPDCIRHWLSSLSSNSTCPLCRCSVPTATKQGQPQLQAAAAGAAAAGAAAVPQLLIQNNEIPQRQQQHQDAASDPANLSRGIY